MDWRNLTLANADATTWINLELVYEMRERNGKTFLYLLGMNNGEADVVEVAESVPDILLGGNN